MSLQLCLMVCLILKLIWWSDIAFDMNTAIVSLTFEILCDIILYTWFGKKWKRLKKFWGWKICLVHTYFFKHLSLSMLISFILTKEKTVIILATMLLKLFCSNLLHSWKLKATRMAPSQYQYFRVYFGFMFLLTLTP